MQLPRLFWAQASPTSSLGLGIRRVQNVSSLVFDDKVTVPGQFGDKIRIESTGGGREPEGVDAAFDVGQPVFNSGVGIDCIGACSFFLIHMPWPLRDAAFFRQVFVDHGAVAWPGEIDLAPDAMYREVLAARTPAQVV